MRKYDLLRASPKMGNRKHCWFSLLHKDDLGPHPDNMAILKTVLHIVKQPFYNQTYLSFCGYMEVASDIRFQFVLVDLRSGHFNGARYLPGRKTSITTSNINTAVMLPQNY